MSQVNVVTRDDLGFARAGCPFSYCGAPGTCKVRDRCEVSLRMRAASKAAGARRDAADEGA